MRSPQITDKSFGKLHADGWRRINELQREINKRLEAIPHPGELPHNVDHQQLRDILMALPAEFDDYMLRLRDRGSNDLIYHGHLVEVLTFIIIASRIGAPLTSEETLSLLTPS